MSKELKIEELTELEVLSDLLCYALGSYELDDFETKEAQEHYDIIQKETKILKSALDHKDKLEKVIDILKNKDIEMTILKATFKFDNETGWFYYTKIWCLKSLVAFDDKKYIEREDYDLLKRILTNEN